MFESKFLCFLIFINVTWPERHLRNMILIRSLYQSSFILHIAIIHRMEDSTVHERS